MLNIRVMLSVRHARENIYVSRIKVMGIIKAGIYGLIDLANSGY